MCTPPRIRKSSPRRVKHRQKQNTSTMCRLHSKSQNQVVWVIQSFSFIRGDLGHIVLLIFHIYFKINLLQLQKMAGGILMCIALNHQINWGYSRELANPVQLTVRENNVLMLPTPRYYYLTARDTLRRERLYLRVLSWFYTRVISCG